MGKRAFSAEARSKTAKSPCHWLVPLLVLMTTEPPVVRPTSAFCCEVCTANSCNASGEKFCRKPPM